MDNEIINNIKTLALDMIENAGSGHTGIVLGAAPIIYTLYSRHLNINLNDPSWINRDRFILSAGHGSALLYACLYMAGYNITLDDLKNFRKIDSKTPGHPEYGVTPGVEVTTGPLGQGLATAVGMALGEKILGDKYVIPKKSVLTISNHLIDYNVYVLCGDGDLMEGISYEAASFAGTLKLNNLIVLYDSNNVSLDNTTDVTFNENVMDRFKALGWNTIKVKNGNSVSAIDRAIRRAKNSSKPTLIEIKTIIGYGSNKAGTNEAHGKAIDKFELAKIKQDFNMPNEMFYVNEKAKEEFKKMISAHSSSKYNLWANNYDNYVKTYLGGEYEKLNYLFDRVGRYNLLDFNWDFERDMKEELRITNQTVMNKISKIVPNFIGGSADLGSSTMAVLSDSNNIVFNNYNGKNICFGVREHAMGAILNGLSLSKFKVFGSTFLAFSDYLKPSIRMSALMNLPVTYIFTHDSVSIGQDGPTHEPVEQLTMLRATPNLCVYRPADAKELVGCWNEILNAKNPSALIISKQELSLLPATNAKYVNFGAYIVYQPIDTFNVIIVATGSEVHTAIHLANDLWNEKKISVRVVSMPCMELYLKQNKEYQKKLLPRNIVTFVIEAGSGLSWGRFIYDESYLITIDKFGKSGKSNDVLKSLEFDYQSIKMHIMSKL
mgnify:FL=1